MAGNSTTVGGAPMDTLDERYAQEAEKPGVRGIAGWLVVPLLVLVVGAIAHFLAALDSPLSAASTEILVLHLAIALGSVVVLTLFVLENSMVPLLCIVLMVLDLALHVLMVVALNTYLGAAYPELVTSEMPDAQAELRISIVYAVFFIPYFLASERVRNTFVK